MLNIAICDDDIQTTGQIEMMIQKIAKRNFADVDIEVFWNGESLADSVVAGDGYDIIYLDMLNCGDPSFGGTMYGCGHCGNLKFVPFRCKSRFCPTCGNKCSIDRTVSMSFKIIKVPHRHCVFTIAKELRPFFLKRPLSFKLSFFSSKQCHLPYVFQYQ